MDVTDTQLLDGAAAKLDRLLAGTTSGRWQVDGPWWHPTGGEDAIPTQMVIGGEDRAAVLLGCPDHGTGRDSGPDLRYAAAMQPAVGRALVRWLQSAAGRGQATGPDRWAVAVAREILGEEGER